MVNRLLLAGLLADVPDVRRTPRGGAVGQFIIEVVREGPDSDTAIDAVPVVCFNRLANRVRKRCFPGEEITVIGHLGSRDGELRVIASELDSPAFPDRTMNR